MAVVKDEWMYEQDTEYDRILGQTTGLLAQRGDKQAVALLVDVRSMALADTDEVIRTEKFIDPWTPTGDDTPAIRTIYRRAAGPRRRRPPCPAVHRRGLPADRNNLELRR